jgi:hypothetical protein
MHYPPRRARLPVREVMRCDQVRLCYGSGFAAIDRLPMPSPRFRALPYVAAVLLGLAGCQATPPPAMDPTPAAATDTARAPTHMPPAAALATGAPAIARTLPDARYPIDTTLAGAAPMRAGLYEEATPTSIGKNVVRLGTQVAYGDLDGDGIADAAVTLIEIPGGSGIFTYLAAVLDDHGAAKPLASILLGDRISVTSITVVGGVVQAAWLDRAAGEPMSATPRTPVRKAFAVRDGKLVAITDAATDAGLP